MNFKNNFGPALLACAGFLVTIQMFYPGIMTSDSVSQYSEALSFSFGDWHPPIMAFIWAGLNKLAPGPLGMLLLHSGLYWAGLFLISCSLRERTRAAAWAIVLIGFLPFLIGTLGYIWKDTLHATSWIFAIGLLAFGGRQPKRAVVLLWAAAFLLLLGSLTRVNAIVGLPPLVWFWLRALGCKSAPRLAGGTVACLIVCLLVGNLFSYGILKARKTSSYQSLLVFDVGGISYFSKTDFFAEPWNAERRAQVLSTCYEPLAWDVYMWGKCSFVGKEIQDSGQWHSGRFAKKWIQAVIQEPAAYITHRATYFLAFLQRPQSVRLDRTYDNPPEFRFRKNAFFDVLTGVTHASENLLFYKPWFWLLTSLGMAACSLRQVRYGRDYDLVLALSLSAFMYLAGYSLIGVASDFRYIYWPILATSSAALIAGSQFRSREHSGTRDKRIGRG